MNKEKIQAITEVVDGKMLAIASDESVDRVGDVLKVTDWDFKNFLQNPVLQAGHDYKPQYTIGVAKNLRVEGKKVIFEPVFHDITQLAREIGEMYRQGVLRAWSVGFIPGNNKGLNELLEISAVAVPANASALVFSKGLDSNEDKEVINEWIKKELDVKGEEITEKAEDVNNDSNALETEEKEKKEVTKGPACRQADETVNECVSRKIAEIMNEDDTISQDQAIAIAESVCSKACELKSQEEVEEKGMIAEELAGTEDEWYAKNDLVGPVDKIIGTFYSILFRGSTKPDQFLTLLDELIVLLIQVKDGAFQETEEDNSEEDGMMGTMLNFDETQTKAFDDFKHIFADEKSGRVISKKNETTIKTAVEAMNNATEALNEVLATVAAGETATEEKTVEEKIEEIVEEIKAEEKEQPIVRKRNATREELLLRAMQKIAKATNETLRIAK